MRDSERDKPSVEEARSLSRVYQKHAPTRLVFGFLCCFFSSHFHFFSLLRASQTSPRIYFVDVFSYMNAWLSSTIHGSVGDAHLSLRIYYVYSEHFFALPWFYRRFYLVTDIYEKKKHIPQIRSLLVPGFVDLENVATMNNSINYWLIHPTNPQAPNKNVSKKCVF